MTNRALRALTPVALAMSVGFTACGNPTAPTVPPQATVTFGLSGTVRESGGGPIIGAKVQIRERSTLTDEFGHYSVTGGLPASVVVTRDGYEDSIASFFSGHRNGIWDVWLQRVTRIAAGDGFAGEILPEDAYFEVPPLDPDGTSCFPCKLVRVLVPADGTVDVRVEGLGGSIVPLIVLKGRSCHPNSTCFVSGPARLAAGDELQVYLQSPTRLTEPAQFQLRTSLRPD